MSRSRSRSVSRSRSPSRSRSRSPQPPNGIQSKDWRSLFVGYLPNHATMDDVEEFFKGFGKIEAISLKPGYGFVTMVHRRDSERVVRELDGKRMAGEKVDIQHAKNGQIKGLGRREYENTGKYTKVNDTRPNQRNNYKRRSRSKSSRSRSVSPRRPNNYNNHHHQQHNNQPKYCIVVQNLTTRCSWQDLKDFIRKETKVETAFCQAHRDKVGEGLVAFHRMADRDEVVRDCDGLMINGKKVTMLSATRKSTSRSRSRSFSRSRSRSNSRGRGRRNRSRS